METNIFLGNSVKPLTRQNGNVAEQWKNWKQRFEIYCDANDIKKQTETKQIAIFLNLIGDYGLEVFNSLNIDRKSTTIENVLNHFDKKFNPQSNITVERYNFFTRLQQQDESLDNYVTILNNLAKSCEFNNLKDSLVKDMFVIGINNSKIRETLLQQEKLTLEDALKIAKSMELSQERSTKITKSQSHQSSENMSSVQQVSKINHRGRSKSRNNFNNYRQRSKSNNRNNNQNSVKRCENSVSKKPCTRCGQVHIYKCPAEGRTCKICKKQNHFANYCFFNKDRRDKSQQQKSSVSCINYDESSCNDNYFIINGLTDNNKICNNRNDEWKINVNLNNIWTKCQIDTGADTNVISKDTLNSIMTQTNRKIHIQRTNNKIFSFSGEIVPNLGSCMLQCEFENGLKTKIYFIVVDCKCQTILGWKTCEKLGIVKRIYKIQNNLQLDCDRSVQSVVSKYSHTFEGIGCLPNEVHLDIDETVKPKVCPIRRIPFSLQNRLKSELENMEKMKIIEKVTKPTKWVNSIVLVEKPNGSLRVCLDPRNLNVAIRRPHYPYPTFNDLRSQVTSSKIFSKLDASSGYWTIKLDEESSDLCTFNTPFGRYKFLRLPYGINSSGEIFHRVMNDLFGDLPGIVIFVDDILVHGRNETEHNERLESVFKRASEVNLKFNKQKCKFGLSEICYVGHIFNQHGVSPDKSKIEAITKMPSPQNVKELQRFLGMINYLGQYIPNLAEETSILRDLLKKQNLWCWTQNHEDQFNKLKSIICKSPVLIHFDVNKPVRMSVDASKSAVGAVIFHGNNPIAYSSKSLTKCQENYAQIEKELYAIVFGCKKFHQYVYGKPIQVETDHQPLVTLFKKPLSEVPSRLQRMMITLQAYDLIVSYTKGSKMYISDTLSRAPVDNDNNLDDNLEEFEQNLNIHINLLTSNLAISQEKLDKISEHSNNDVILQKLKQYFFQGWPQSKNLCDSLVLPYWNVKEEIHVINNILFKNNSVIIPTSMRTEILNTLHEGHLGIEKTKNLARGIVFWPNINQDIENKVKQCETCAMYSLNKSKESLLSHEKSIFPWQKLATDLFEYKNQKYLLVVDYYSNYIEIANLKNDTRSSSVINSLKCIFARHGIPLQLVSDGGPPYNSKEFKQFLHEWDVEHIISSPYMARSNGLAEVSVKTVKNILRKCEESGTDPHIGLLQHRTSQGSNMYSPSQLLMSRQLRTKLPSQISQLKPKIVKFSEYSNIKDKNLQKTKNYYNKSCKNYQEFHVNDNIYFKKNPKDIIWTKGQIISKTKLPRSFIIQDNFGKTYRRNSQHIRPDYCQQKQHKKSIKFDDLNGQKTQSHFQSQSNQSFENERDDDSCQNYTYIITRRKTNSFSSPSQVHNNSYCSNTESNVESENYESLESNQSESNVTNQSVINSPEFVNVNDDVSCSQSLCDYNEYQDELILTSPPQSCSEEMPNIIISPDENKHVSENVNKYSSRGRLLKKTQKFDL